MIGRSLSSDPHRAFSQLHGYAAPSPKSFRYRLPKGHLVDLYKVTRIEGDRIVDIGTGKHTRRFYHDFAPGHGPTLAADEQGFGHLIGGDYKITSHGIEDTEMHNYMVRNTRGRFVPMHRYEQSNPFGGAPMGYHSNPWNPMLAGLALIGGGLLGGVLVNAAVQALPARVGDTVKDGVSLGIAALAVWIPKSSGARLMGITTAAVLVGGVINRRTDVTNRLIGWVHTQFARLYDRAGAMGSGQQQVTPPTRGVGQLSEGVDAMGLPTMQWSGQGQMAESYAGSMS